MPRQDMPRFSREPILAMCRQRDWTLEELAQRSGISPRRLHDTRGLAWSAADKAAIALGSHPGIVWPKEWWEMCAIYDSVPHPYVRDRYRQRVSNWHTPSVG